MVARFACSGCTVMTAATHIGRLTVGKRRNNGQPRCKVVTGFAHVACQWMGGGFISSTTYTIMTARLRTRLSCYSGVIKTYL